MKKAIFAAVLLLLSACASAAGGPEPTATESSTLTPTPIPSLTFTPTPTPPPDGPCDNPLVPLVIGNHWKYRVTTEGGEQEYNLRVLERQDSGNILMRVEFADQDNSVQERVVCLDGVIEDFPLFVMDMLFADRLNKFMNTYHDKGVYAPAHATFEEAGWILDWQANYLTEDSAEIANPLAGPDLIVGVSSPINLTFQMDGRRESVTVPAGDFAQAIKVLHNFTVSATLGSSGGHLTIETRQWYEPYVGLVRAQVDSASYSMGAQDLSVPWNSVLELIEFTQGKR